VVTQKGEQLPFGPFRWTQSIPFPTETSPSGRWLPYIAFNYMGQLVDDRGNVTSRNEYIPLALGSVGYARNQGTRQALAQPPSVTETPAGNSTNSFNVVNIEWLTGRARVERLEVR
jgi:hypothetical protein